MSIEDDSGIGESPQRQKVSRGPGMDSAASSRCPCVIQLLSCTFSPPGECKAESLQAALRQDT